LGNDQRGDAEDDGNEDTGDRPSGLPDRPACLRATFFGTSRRWWLRRRTELGPCRGTDRIEHTANGIAADHPIQLGETQTVGPRRKKSGEVVGVWQLRAQHRVGPIFVRTLTLQRPLERGDALVQTQCRVAAADLIAVRGG
jgi:hypothetical protein